MKENAQLTNLLSSIKPTSKSFLENAQKNWDLLAHPPGSLGELEAMVCKLAAIQNTENPTLEKKCVCVFASDNGVFEEGVTTQPQITTFYLAEAMANGKTGLTTIAKTANTEVKIYDAGLIRTSENPKVTNIKLRCGTSNIAKGPAMSREECTTLILKGAEIAKQVYSLGYSIVGVGELGICNTTTTAALLSAISKKAATETVGSGASTTVKMRHLKITTVEKALKVNSPDPTDIVDCISKVGGFDLACMCGFFLGAASVGGAAVIDGFISSVAALCAIRLSPQAKDYLFASHASEEKGANIATELLGLAPPFHLKLRLGEGSGCPLFFSLLETALYIYKNMARFTDTPIEKKDLVDLRKEEAL